MSLVSRLWTAGGTLQRRTVTEPVQARDGSPVSMSWEAWQNLFTFNGNQYLVGRFGGVASQYLIGACGPVHTVLDRRASIMGEARPSFQRLERGKPTELFSTPALDALKRPWDGGTFRQLVTICESDVASHGQSYWIRPDRFLARLDPDWVTIVVEKILRDEQEVGSRLLGYVVQKPSSKGVIYEPGEVAHYRPGPSIHEPFRGESWLASVASDATSDVEMTTYKGNYLKNGAMPSLAVMYEPGLDMTQLEQFVPQFASKFTGSMNAGKIMHFLGGRDVKTVGATLDQLAFKAVQGAGESRIAAAAGVPATVAGFSEGMQGSSLNAGNYTATRRLFGDAKIRPLLGSFFDAFANLVPPPDGARLHYDDSGVSFFQEDVMDEAEIQSRQALTIESLIRSGFKPDIAARAVYTGDFSILEGGHTGLFSVQLQPPGTEAPTPSEGTVDDDSA